jgi:hypothetical protein
MLETHIERLGPPGQVLLVHAYHVWHRALPPFATAHVPLPFGFWRELEPRLEAGAGWSLESFVARYLPLYAEHRSLAQLLMRPWQAKRHYRVDERGFLAASVPLPAGVDRDARRRLDWLAGIDGLGVSPENRAALERIGALADQHGFDVYLVNAPVYRGIAEAPAFRRHQRHVAALLAGVDERYARVRYVPREFHFERAVMQNGDHLLADAAKGYTRGLAAEIVRLRHAEQLADAKRPPR